MTMYVPTLKGKLGELKAWQNASPAVLGATRPIVEVVETGGLEHDLGLIAKRMGTYWPAASVLTLDCGVFDCTAAVGATGLRPLQFASAQALAQGRTMKAVIRIDDPDVVLGDAGAADADHHVGACLRIGSVDAPPNPVAAAAELPRVVAATGLATTSLDLVIDLGAVGTAADVTASIPVAAAMLAWAATNGPWASTTLLSGAFPATISNLPTGLLVPLIRHDAEVFVQVIAATGAAGIDYGDYSIGHPAMAAPVPYAGLPNLRYLSGQEWVVVREQRALPGNESFFTVCGRVVGSPHWAGAAFSWGDTEVQRCSTSTGGPGGGTEWRAFGTSHHVAGVVHGLTTLGAP